MRSKKVLFVIDTLQLGGAEQSLLANANRFQFIEPIICHLYPGDILKDRFIEKGIKVYSLNVRSKYGFVKAYRQLMKVTELEKPDLIVGYITRSEIISRMVGYSKKIPVIGTFINDIYAPIYNKHLSWSAKKMVSIFKIINKATSKVCVGFIANSQAIKDANAKHLAIPLDKIKVINRGRESHRIKYRTAGIHNSDGSMRFLNVSRLFPVKGQKELILGFKKFVDQYSNATLDIVGDGPSRGELLKTIRENHLEDKIFLLGARIDVLSIMANYDCFIFPSFMEGFSGSVVEAMFAGLPILASNIGPNQEAIKHLQTGYLFEKESVDEIEKALLWFNENRELAEKMAIKAYDYAKEHFELDTIVKQFESYLYQNIQHVS